MTAPAKGIQEPCVGYGPVSGFVDPGRFTGSPLLRSNVAESGMEMLRIVPVHKFGIPLPSIGQGCKKPWVIYSVFERLVPGFDEGIVIATAGT